MQSAAKPKNEDARLKKLRQMSILDTLPEKEYDRIIKQAARICDTPIALLTLIDADRQWFKSKLGLDAQETPRDIAFCAHAILEPDHVLHVRDALEDQRFADNPAVTGAPNVRFYAGAPLKLSTGEVMGTLCVADTKPRELTPQQLDALEKLAAKIMALLETRIERKVSGRNPVPWAIALLTAFMALASLLSYEQQASNDRNAQWVRHTYTVTYFIQNLQFKIGDAERSMHRYRLSGEPHDLKNYQRRVASETNPDASAISPTSAESKTPDVSEEIRRIDQYPINQQLTLLHALVIDNPQQKAHLEQLQAVLATLQELWAAEAAKPISPDAAWQQRDNFLLRQPYFSKATELTTQMAAEEGRLLAIRSHQAAVSHRNARLLDAGYFAAVYLTAVTCIVLYQRRRRVMNTQLSNYIDQVEKTSRSLYESNQYINAVLSSATHMIIATDLTGKVTLFNRQAERALGYSAEEMLYKLTPGIWHDAEEIKQRAQKLSIELGEPIAPGINVFTAKAIRDGSETSEWTFIHKSGSRFLGRLVLTPIRSAEGDITGYFAIVEDITQAREAENERSKLLSIIEQAPDYIGVSDMQGNLQYHNRAAKILAGLPDDYDMTQLKIADMHPAWATKMIQEQAIPTVLRRGMWTGETAILRQDGSELPVSQMLTMYRDKHGNPAGFATIMRDITLRRIQEEKLAEMNDFNELITHSNPDYVFVKDAEFRIVKANKAFFDIYPEHMRDSIIGTTTLENFAPEDVEIFLQKDREAFETGSSENYEKICMPDGQEKHLFTKKVRFENSRGEKFILGIARDVTQFKLAEEALRKSETALQLGWQGTGVGMWDWDVKTNELEWSDRFNALLGYKPGELPTRYEEWENRLHAEDKEMAVGAVKAYLAHEAPSYSIQYRLITKQGEWRWYHATGKAIWDADGHPLRMVGTLDDITERMEAETERGKLLMQVMQSNTNLERFAYVASHDMQEPLRMIANFSTLIMDEYKQALDETGQEYLMLVHDSATRMQSMIEDLLAYARVKNDQTRFSEVNAETEFSHVMDNLAAAVRECRAVVTHDRLPNFQGNPVQFMRLLQNLIGNGLKYQLPETRPRVHVGVKDVDEHWQFTVSDNGIGIDERFVGQVFEPFKRLHSWDEIKGSGIGLAVCKQIVESHGGTIWATSIPRKGSMFYFTIKKGMGVASHKEAL